MEEQALKNNSVIDTVAESVWPLKVFVHIRKPDNGKPKIKARTLSMLS
jgi:hypothetical protein